MACKSIDALMRHLRSANIDISGSVQKRQLMNVGYYHGYKGYRIFGHNKVRIPFTSFKEIYLTICYDAKLKALLYDKIMFIETAVRNIALECIVKHIGSGNIRDMLDKAVLGYNNAPSTFTTKTRVEMQERKLNLQNTIQRHLTDAYRHHIPYIVHFYNHPSKKEVPLWALFETFHMGDLGLLLSLLTYDIRDDISRTIGFNLHADTNRELIYRYLYTLKDLRNAIAHNAVVYDARFGSGKPNRAMQACLMQEIGLSYVNFETIGDYIILVAYYLKLMKMPKIEIKKFISDVEKLVVNYQKEINTSLGKMLVHPDMCRRLAVMKNFL